MNRMKMIIVALLMALGLTGCITEEFNLRAIKEDRYLVSADSTSNAMKWRTTKWSNTHAKYWASAGVIITTPENTLYDTTSAYWLKKIVSKGFKGTILIEEDFSYFPLTWGTEPSGSYKRDINNYFTALGSDWYVKTPSGNPVLFTHPDFGYCMLPNPAKFSIWGSGAYNILQEHIDDLVAYTGADVLDFQVGVFQPYRSSTWEPHKDYETTMESLLADPLTKGYGIASYTASDMGEFSVLQDNRMLAIKNKGFPIVVKGNRLDSNTERLVDKSVIGVFFENVTYENMGVAITKANTYRSSFEATSSEDALLMIAGVTDDIYHSDRAIEYAQTIKAMIDNAIYFTSGADGLYWNYPRNKPGDWWVRNDYDSNWQDNRNNPEYESFSMGPRKTFGLTPPEPDVDTTPPEQVQNLVATSGEHFVSLDWDSNSDVDMAYYRVYVSTTGELGEYSEIAENIIPSQYSYVNDEIGSEFWYKVKAFDTSGNSSLLYSNSDNATPFDLTPLSAPSGLAVVNGALDFQLSISWTPLADAVSYNVWTNAGDGGSVYTDLGNISNPYNYNSAAIATVPTEFSFYITSTDEYENISDASAIVTATTSNHLSSGTPENFTLDVDQGEITLAWEVPTCCGWVGSTPPADFVSYIVYRGTTQLNMVELLRTTDLTIVDTPQIGTLYYYNVSTIDSAFNESSPTPNLSGIAVDTVGPSAPTSVVVTEGDASLNVSWVNSTDQDLDHVNIYRSDDGGFVPTNTDVVGTGNLVGQSSSNTFLDDVGLENDTPYYYLLKSVDVLGNIGTETSILAEGTPAEAAPPEDLTAPPVPLNVTASQNLGTGINVSWSAVVAGDLSHYNVYRGTVSGTGTRIATNILTTSYSDTDATLVIEQPYYYTITSVDNSVNANESIRANCVEAIGKKIDLTAPIAPTVTSAGQRDGNVVLFWYGNTELDIGSYNIYKTTTSGSYGSTPYATSTAQMFTDTDVLNGTTYYYKVSAVDNSPQENESPLSTQVSVTPKDLTSPSSPSNVQIVAGDEEVTITWTASTDLNGAPVRSGVSKYYLYRGTTPTNIPQYVLDITSTTYTDESVTNGTTYYYQVMALDANENISIKSAVISATPIDAIRPVAPTWATVDPIVAGDNEITLNWNANTEPDLDHYEVLFGLNGGVISTFSESNVGTATTYTHTGLTNESTYSYQIIAYDEVGPSERSTIQSTIPNQQVAPLAPEWVGAGISVTNGVWEKDAVAATSNPVVRLDWTASTDADYYEIHRGFGRDKTFVDTVLSPTTIWDDPNPIGGSPHYYEIKAVNRLSTGALLISDSSTEVSGTPRTIRQLPFPFYMAMWSKDLPNTNGYLTDQDIVQLSNFDGMHINNFVLNQKELAFTNILPRIREINPDFSMTTYINTHNLRSDYLTSSSFDNTIFRELANWAESQENDGDPLTNAYFKYKSGGSYNGTSWVAGDRMTNGAFSTSENPIWLYDFTNLDLAKKIAEIYVRALDEGGSDGEYSGFMLDFTNLTYQSWICFGGCESVLDADGDGIFHGVDASEEAIDENSKYQVYLNTIVKEIRRQFAERGMSNRLIISNGNGIYASKNSPYSNTQGVKPEYLDLLDGWFFEQWNTNIGVPGYRGMSTIPPYGTPENPHPTLTPDVVDEYFNFKNKISPQINPPALMWEAVTDSNMQYMNEPIVMAANGWIQENIGLKTVSTVAPTSERPEVARGESNTWVSKLPLTSNNRLPDPGDWISTTYNTGANADTLVVEYDNYIMNLALINPPSGAGYLPDTGNPFYPFAYYVEQVNPTTRVKGNILRRSGQHGATGSYGSNLEWPTPYPSIPTGLVATTGLDGSSIILDWDDSTNFGYKNGFYQYNIYRSISQDGTYELLATNSTSTYTDTGLPSETSFWYKVSVVNDRSTHLESSKTSYVTAQTLDTMPPSQPILVGAVGDNTVYLSWTTSSDAVSVSIYTYEFVGGEWVTIPYDQDTYPWSTGYLGGPTGKAIAQFANDVEIGVEVEVYDSRGNAIRSNRIYVTPTSGISESLTFIDGPDIVGPTNDSGYVGFDWSAEVNINAFSKAPYSKNEDALPSVSTLDGTWNSASKLHNESVTTNIPTPVRDSNTNVTLAWVQSVDPDHYHIERKIDNGSWVSLSTSVLGSAISYIDSSAPRGKLEYRIASVDAPHASETVGDIGNWVELSEVDNVEIGVAYNEAVQLNVAIDIATDNSTKLRSDEQHHILPAPDITPPVATMLSTVSFDTTSTNIQVSLSLTALENVQSIFQWSLDGITYLPIADNWQPASPTTAVSRTIDTGYVVGPTGIPTNTTIYTRFKLRDAALNETSFVTGTSVFRRASIIGGTYTTININPASGSAPIVGIPIVLTEANLPSDIFTLSTNGGDVRFSMTNPPVTFLPREIVSFNPLTSTAQIHVKVTLSNTVVTPIYCYYGTILSEPLATDYDGKYAVWSGNYVFVNHMESGVLNSSSSGNNGAKYGSTPPYTSPAKIGNGQNFSLSNSGSNSYVGIADNPTLDIGTGNATWSFWWYASTAREQGFFSHTQVSDAKSGYWSSRLSPTRINFCMDDDDHDSTLVTPSILELNWNYITIVKSGTSILYYINGSLKDTVTGITNINDSSDLFKIGVESCAYGTISNLGIIDEFRFSNVARSSDWIQTEYNNQSTPEAFLAVIGRINLDNIEDLNIQD